MIAPGSEMNKEMVAAANIPHISFHDIRRTISTGMKELGVPHRVISLTPIFCRRYRSTLQTSGTPPTGRDANCIPKMGEIRWRFRITVQSIHSAVHVSTNRMILELLIAGINKQQRVLKAMKANSIRLPR